MGDLVLITGGAGFIGTALRGRLIAAGHGVRILDNLEPQVHDTAAHPTSDDFVWGSVTDRAAFERALEGVDAVVHLAAGTGTGQSMYETPKYVEVNAGGTALLLDVMAHSNHRVRKIVVASSRAVYGEGKYAAPDGTPHYPEHRDDIRLAAGRFDPVLDDGTELVPVPTDETSQLHPSSIYGVTKLTQEQLVLAGARALGVAAVALRYQNVYGPGQSLSNPYTGILSIFSTLIREGSEINVFEDGLESRDFVYIDDVARATESALFTDAADGLAINIGSGVATSVLEVISQLERALGRPANARVTGDYRIGDIRHNVADIGLARRVLAFEPTLSFAEGVAGFSAWVQDQPAAVSDYRRSLDELRARSLLK